jgi:hypothetical protein
LLSPKIYWSRDCNARRAAARLILDGMVKFQPGSLRTESSGNEQNPLPHLNKSDLIRTKISSSCPLKPSCYNNICLSISQPYIVAFNSSVLIICPTTSYHSC